MGKRSNSNLFLTYHTMEKQEKLKIEKTEKEKEKEKEFVRKGMEKAEEFLEEKEEPEYKKEFEISQGTRDIAKEELYRENVGKQKEYILNVWFNDPENVEKFAGIPIEEMSEQRKISLAKEKGALEDLAEKGLSGEAKHKDYKRYFEELESLTSLTDEMGKDKIRIESQFLILHFLDRKAENLQKEITAILEKGDEGAVLVKNQELDRLFGARKEIAEKISGRDLRKEAEEKLGPREEKLEEKEKYIESNLLELIKKKEEKLKKGIEKARTPVGEKVSDRATEIHGFTRNFYLSELGYSVKYKGLLRGKAWVLDEKGEVIKDEKTGKPIEFKTKFRPKGETPVIKFLKEELKNKKRTDLEGVWSEKKEKEIKNEEKREKEIEEKIEEAVKKIDSLEGGEGAIKKWFWKLRKDKIEEYKRELGKKEKGVKVGKREKTGEEEVKDMKERIRMNISQILEDFSEGTGIFDKKKLGEITIEKNAKDVVELLKRYGEGIVDWPEDFEDRIREYDKKRQEKSKFEKAKGTARMINWVLKLFKAL